VAGMTFGTAKKSRFPYWVIPTVIFVFGIGMFIGRAMDSDLTIMEFRNQQLTVGDVVDRLWPRQNVPAGTVPARTVLQHTQAENRLKSENARLMTEKDALVGQVQAMRSEVRAREDSIKGLRNEINDVAKLNQQLLELNKENEKFKQQVAIKRETAQKKAAAPKRVAAAAKPAVKQTPQPAPKPVPQKTTVVVKPRPKPKPAPVVLTRSRPAPRSQGPAYQVLRRTPILRSPANDAQVLYYLNPGRSVQVRRIVNGQFMQVQYSSANPPGYVRVGDVMRLQ